MNTTNNSKKTGLWAAAALALALGSGAAMAADQGYYVGGDVASSSMKMGGDSQKRSGDSYSIFGGYRFDKNFAVEAAYTDLGKVNFNGVEAKNKAYSVDGIARAPLGKDFGLYGRVGVAHYERDYTGLGDNSSNGVKLGVGADYALTKNVSLRAEVTRYTNLPQDYGFGKKLDRVGLGLAYQF
jgi:OOP family OmpA-OmpF porin